MINTTKVRRNYFYISQLNSEERRILEIAIEYGVDPDGPWKEVYGFLLYLKDLEDFRRYNEEQQYKYWNEQRNKDSDNPEI